MFENKDKKNEVGQFTFDQALERFKLLSSVGAEGQQILATFKSGSTIILSDYFPGTIIREKIEDMETQTRPRRVWYMFWCIGNSDQSSVQVFRSASTLDPENPVYKIDVSEKGWGVSIIQAKIISPKGLGRVEFKVLEAAGTILDKTLPPNNYAATRSTLQLDILQMGKRVAEKKDLPESSATQWIPGFQPSKT